MPRRKSQVSNQGPSNIEIVIVVLAQLGGATRKVHTEQIAVKAYELAPDRFSWNLPEYRSKNWPDKQAVRFALENEKRKENGRRVDGDTAHGDSARDGWRLSPVGAEWIAANQDRILKSLTAKPSSIPRREAQRFCKRLKKETVYQSFVSTGAVENVSRYDFTDLLLCSPDAHTDTIRLKFDRLLAVAHLVGDSEILSFLNACQHRFPELLGESVTK
jgi:hypothetical protein